MQRLLTTAAVCASLLALPASALAQSAGDDQYSDPLAPTEQPSGQSQPGSGTGQPGSGTSEPAPSTGTPTPSNGASAPSTTAQSSAEGDGGGALPRTGLNVVLLLVAGSWLLLAGIALRRVNRSV